MKKLFLILVVVLMPISGAYAANDNMRKYTEKELRAMGRYFIGEDPSAETGACTVTATAAAPNTPNGSIVYMMGDSITQGAEQNLSTDLVEAGFSVANIDGVVSRSITSKGKGDTNGSEALDADANDIKRADVAIIALGTNDSANNNADTFKSQGEGLINKLKTINPSLKRIYWVNLFSPALGDRITRYNVVISGFSAIATEPKISISAIDMSAAGISMSSDNLHPNSDGYAKYSEVLTAAISGSGTAAAVQATNCGGTSTELVGNDNAAKVWNYLTSTEVVNGVQVGLGLTPVQAAGFMGNLQHEAHFEPRLVQYGKKNPTTGEISKSGQPSSLSDKTAIDDNTGYGIAQWTSKGRQQALHDFAQQRGLIDGDLGLQLDFLKHELTSPGYLNNLVYTPLLQVNISGSDPTEAIRRSTDIVLEKFECPAACNNLAKARREKKSASEIAELERKYQEVLTVRTNAAVNWFNQFSSGAGSTQ